MDSLLLPAKIEALQGQGILVPSLLYPREGRVFVAW